MKQIADEKLEKLNAVIGDDKSAKQIHNAAKRHFGKKRPATEAESPTIKKPRKSVFEVPDVTELEDSMALPRLEIDESVLGDVVLKCNRAPVVLAFGVMLLKYTMPHQPLSSRLSLSQAVVSLNSRSKAVSLGIEKGASAEEEGFGVGFGSVKIMGREVKTLKRIGWENEEHATQSSTQTVQGDSEDQIALWGMDLEALKAKESTEIGKRKVNEMGELPIHTPQSARSYLSKSFEIKSGTTETAKKAKGATAAEKERALGLLLGALDVLYASWNGSVSSKDLDNKAWGWYVRVRPSIPHGVDGWGAKGEIKLKDILDLRRKG